MDQIAGRNQPVSHPAALTCGSCIRASQRAAAGTTRAGPCGRRLLATAVASDPGNRATSARGGQAVRLSRRSHCTEVTVAQRVMALHWARAAPAGGRLPGWGVAQRIGRWPRS
jgi:hypothetical protein